MKSINLGKDVIMKRYVKASTMSGTVFYELTPADIIEHSLYSDNCWFVGALNSYRLGDIIDLNNLPIGSFASQDNLYICETDGSPIVIDGNEYDVNEVDINDVSEVIEYVDDNAPDSVYRMITDSDIIWRNVPRGKLAQRLLDDNSLDKVVNDALYLNLVEID